MQHISQVVHRILEEPWNLPPYVPPRWESPIEKMLWDALRYHGLQVETQVPIERFRVDMVVSNRLSDSRLVVECDGAEYHSFLLLDDFRDDIIEESGWQICRIRGSEIVRRAERCAVTIIWRWFPELADSFGCREVLEQLYQQDCPPFSGSFKDYLDGFWFRAPVRYRPHGDNRDDPRIERDMVRAAFGDRWRSLADLAHAHIELFHPQPERGLKELKGFLSQRGAA